MNKCFPLSMELRYTACCTALYRFAHLRPIETFKVEQGRHISSDKRPIFAKEYKNTEEYK